MEEQTDRNPQWRREGSTGTTYEGTASHSAGTDWERFFRAAPATDMDAFDDTVTASRAAESREWEVFCRECESDPLTHVGSVSAPSVTVAREQATRLFGHATAALWLCPADEVHRLQQRDLGVGSAPDDETPGDRATATTPRGGERG